MIRPAIFQPVSADPKYNECKHWSGESSRDGPWMLLLTIGAQIPYIEIPGPPATANQSTGNNVSQFVQFMHQEKEEQEYQEFFKREPDL